MSALTQTIGHATGHDLKVAHRSRVTAATTWHIHWSQHRVTVPAAEVQWGDTLIHQGVRYSVTEPAMSHDEWSSFGMGGHIPFPVHPTTDIIINAHTMGPDQEQCVFVFPRTKPVTVARW